MAQNNVAGSAAVSLQLPAALNGEGTVKLRFYYHNGPNGVTGSRPKISIDNLLVTSVASETAPTITSFNPEDGDVGTVVTIAGTNFTGATDVSFNGTPASYTVDSATQITATVALGTTTGPISVTTPDGTAYSSTNFEMPVVPTVTVVSEMIDEDDSGYGTVSINEPAESDIEVTLVSSDPEALEVESPVTIFQGDTWANFYMEAPAQEESYDDIPVIVTPTAAGFASEPGIITVKNKDVPPIPPPPSTSLTNDGYAQDFSGFTSAETLPLGWSISGTGAYNGDWGTGTSAGMRGNANVFGFQHTGSTGTVQQVLTLKNDTGSTITDLTVSYLGMVARAAEGRVPAYTVTVAGQTVAALAYSTSSGVNEQQTASITGLSIAPEGVFQIIWTSDRGSGSDASRQIGIGNVSVTLGASAQKPSVASLSIPLGTIGENAAEVSANVTSDGGEAITVRGFVYSKTSDNNDPEIGGTGVINVVDGDTGVGIMNASLSGLDGYTNYSIKAYATNAEGTAYTSVQTFTTLAPPALFDGTYVYPFNEFLGVNGLPVEWTAISSGGIQSYVNDWTSGLSIGGFYGNESNPGVMGYLHTGDTGILTVTLRLKNDTGSTLTQLNVSYLGRVERVANTRLPQWTVRLDGNEVAELAYSTGAGVDELKTATITGLNIPDGASFTLTWSSERGEGSGSSRRIGLANVQVSAQPITDPVINVTGSLTSFSTIQGTPSASQSFAASGSNLVSSIEVTAPANYEVSLDNTAFAPSVNLVPSGGIVASTPVYVRIAATAPVGNPAGLVSLTNPGAETKNISVTGTVSAAAGGFDEWSGGQPPTPALVALYAVGGASSPTANDGIPSASALVDGKLTLTAIVRTDDPNLVIVGVATADLANGPWLQDGVTSTAAEDQTGVPAGNERRIYSIDKDANTQLFLRLQAILNP